MKSALPSRVLLRYGGIQTAGSTALGDRREGSKTPFPPQARPGFSRLVVGSLGTEANALKQPEEFQDRVDGAAHEKSGQRKRQQDIRQKVSIQPLVGSCARPAFSSS